MKAAHSLADGSMSRADMLVMASGSSGHSAFMTTQSSASAGHTLMAASHM
jgi:hypothetical protein